jgi:hypothetical protein
MVIGKAMTALVTQCHSGGFLGTVAVIPFVSEVFVVIRIIDQTEVGANFRIHRFVSLNIVKVLIEIKEQV